MKHRKFATTRFAALVLGLAATTPSLGFSQPVPPVNTSMGCSPGNVIGNVAGALGCVPGGVYANATTDSSGAWSVTFASTLSSSTPIVEASPVISGATQPGTCVITARSATAASGKCFQTQNTVLSLSIVTAGLTLQPAVALGSGVAVQVVAKEPTQ